MLKSEDVLEFNNIIRRIRNLVEAIHAYNPKAKICLNACCDENEKDDCGIFLIDDSALDSESMEYLSFGEKYRNFIRKGFVAGGRIEDAELFSRSEIAKLIEEYEKREAVSN